MDGRIGSLHVRYRVPPGSTIAAALAPGLDRAISTRMGEAVAERLSLVLGADAAVIVVRELKTRVVLGPRDCTLDSHAIEKISRASVDALTDLLRDHDDPESVMRFADQAEFIGSFIVDLLQGSAWDRWYYGAFQPYKRADVRASLVAVLADHQLHAARVFAWLARRGRLSDVLKLLGSSEARRFASGERQNHRDAPAPDVRPLADAAFALVEALGWPARNVDVRRALLAEFLSTAPLPPSWADRRALSAWVIACARAIVGGLARRGRRREGGSIVLVRELLTGPLDWLDAEWLATELEGVVDRRNAGDVPLLSAARLLAPRHERILARLAQRIAEGRLRFDGSDDRDSVFVRLVAALAEEGVGGEPLDRALLASVERIADAWQVVRPSARDRADLGRILASTPQPFRSSAPVGQELESRLELLRAAGPAALEVLRAIAGVTAVVQDDGDLTAFGGLYLVTRGILDVRLAALAENAHVPFAPLRAALAMQWLGLGAPFDTPTSLWLGTDSADVSPLWGEESRLADLERSLLATLIDQRCIDALPADDDPALNPSQALLASGCAPDVSAGVARIAWMVMRAWGRWLPGLSHATPAFLIAKALVRDGRAIVSESRVHVVLEPAPLDVVLEMAGYFKQIDVVPWLGGRTIDFDLDRHAVS